MTKSFRFVFYTVRNDNRKEKLMDWAGGTNWRNEKLEKKSANLRDSFTLKVWMGNIKMHNK